jgi:hypothetical protein
MATASFNKLNFFVQDVANKVHNLGSDQLVIALTDVSPVATSHVLTDITQIAYTNLSSRNITTASSVETAGIYNLKLSNITLTATGAVAQFRYIVIYNSTAASGNLIGWYDYGAEVNMVNGDTFPITFDGTNGLISIT